MLRKLLLCLSIKAKQNTILASNTLNLIAGDEGARHLFLVSGTFLTVYSEIFLDLLTFLCCTD